jgi:hypothetical protein
VKVKKPFASLLLFAATSLAFAGDVNINRCNMRFANALNRLEIKGASALDIIELKIDKPIDYIFGERKLTMAPLETKFQEKKALYRYPGVASKVHKHFESVKFIKDMPDKDLAKLLEPNTIYTYTIQDKKLSIAKSKPGVIRDYASKHMLLSADESAGELRMAGEMWVDDKGILHYDPGSGTYKPGNEDLKKAEVFFNSHLGIKASQAHYFEAPAQIEAIAAAPQKSSLTIKIKQIEAAQVAILQKRRLLAGYKFSLMSNYRLNEAEQKLKKDNISFTTSSGAVVEYKIVRVDPTVTEEVDFDDPNSTLANKHGTLRQSRTFDLKNETKMKPMKPDLNSSATIYAANLGARKDQLIPVKTSRSEEVVYKLMPLNNGKTTGIVAATITMVKNDIREDGVTRSEYSAVIEKGTLNAKNDQAQINLMDKIQQMLELN